MNLAQIEIKSFRSIVEQVINVNDNCIGFIGLNESGKTNVLKAIRSLEKDHVFSIKDKSKINDRNPDISFSFDLDINEENEILTLCNTLLKNQIVEEEDIIIDLKITNIKIKKSRTFEEKSFITKTDIFFETTFTFSNDYYSLINISNVTNDFLISYADEEVQLNLYKLVESKYVPDDLKENYEKINEELIQSKIYPTIKEKIIEYIPFVNYWEYTPQYLLPGDITYEEFMKDKTPFDYSAPLYNIFLIAKDLNIWDEEDLSDKIDDWKIDSSLRRKDSEIITRSINRHIKKIWEDYDQELRIELEESKITIHVNDPKSSKMNFYDMGSRSQGFKTFISFILTVTAEIESGQLENFVLILDEPEAHLHPSGVRYMKNELMELSNSNNVFYATHSIFMIDRGNLKRHIIVNKKDEITNLTEVNRNNIIQESVIYEALGTSVDEFSISSCNFLFEGELDRKIFQFFFNKCVEKRENKIIDYEYLDGGGTKKITQFFHDKVLPSHSKWNLILDSDSAGRNLKTNISKKLSESFVTENMKFYYYSEVKDEELEDLMPIELVKDSFIKASSNIKINEKFPINFNQEKPVGHITNEYYGRNKISTSDKALIEAEFKQNLDIEISSILNIIQKETTIEKRLDKFIELLELYYKFIEKIVNDFEINLKYQQASLN